MRVARIVLRMGFGPLLFVQRVIYRLHLLRLIEIDVVLVVAIDAVSVIDRPAPGRAGLGIAIATKREVMATEEPSIRRLAVWLTKNRDSAALERAAGIPLVMASQPFQGFVILQDRPQCLLDQILLRLGKCLVDTFVGAQRRRVVRFLPRRMPFGAVIIWQHQLAL